MFKKRCFSFLLLSFSFGCFADNFPDTDFIISQAHIKYIYDGDTFFLVCPECDKEKMGVRILGYDSAEIRGKCDFEINLARQAKAFTVDKLRNAREIVLKPNSKRKYDRYGRLLAWVYVDGVNLADLLISNNLARKYNGEKRKSWCD